MGGSVGKFFYYSYNMEDRHDIRQDEEISNGRENVSEGSQEKGQHSDDQSDEKSSGSGETTCASLRTRSENWSKKRRSAKSSVPSKKDCFGKRNKKWPIIRKSKEESPVDAESLRRGSLSCVCTMYRRTNSEMDPGPGPGSSNKNTPSCQEPGPSGISTSHNATTSSNPSVPHHIPVIDLSKFNPADYPIDDEDERMRRQRAKEMVEGVDLSTLTLQEGIIIRENAYPAHSQIDFIHYLVPDLKEITNCSFYWGKIDRYEAEKLLEGKSDGTFVLRDSAQEEYLFSVSFRRYGRSLHARIEQWNNQFSFDSHDPSVFSSPTVTGLIEHYKDPSCCMFFEPMLTTPLHRNFPFSLQHLARAMISSQLKYDSINLLPLPKSLKMYLKEYHYKQRVRIRRLE